MAIKKPKKVTMAKMAPTGKGVLAKPKAPPKVTQPAAPAAPAQVPVPAAPIVTTPPRPSLNTATDRQSAMRQYTEAMNEVNAQIRDLAMNYGGASKVLQYGYDPSGADTQNELSLATAQPGTQLEALLRNLKANKQNVNDSYLAGGAFVGSQRVDKLGELDKGYEGDLSAAERAYQQSLAALTRQLLAEQGGRNEVFTRATNEDLIAANQAPPEAQSGQAPPEAQSGVATSLMQEATSAPIPSSRPVPVGKGVQQESFSEYRNSNGHLVRDYGNGKKKVYVNGVWKWVK